MDETTSLLQVEISIKLVENLYRQLNSQYFDNSLPVCNLELSTRLTRTAGKIWPRQRLLRLSLPYHQRYGLPELSNTLLHEMVHLWLYEQGLPSGHTASFRQKMRDLGVADRIHALPMPPSPLRYLYGCPTCKREIRTRRLINSSCGLCDVTYNPRHKFRLISKLSL